MVIVPLTIVALAIWALYMWQKSQPQNKAIEIISPRIKRAFCIWRKNRPRADDEESEKSGASHPINTSSLTDRANNKSGTEGPNAIAALSEEVKKNH